MTFFRSINFRRPFSPVICTVGWYVFWLAMTLCLYKSGLLMFPKKDHFFFMLGRQLFDNDLVWFFKTLSYNRTRVLFPGDYFAFRPILMAVLGLEDIFLRHHLLALGIIGCSLFSFTATAFFFLTRRIAGLFPAVFLTLVWSANLAGSEILLWQHISAYVLAPGFLCMALLLLTSEDVDIRQCWVAGLLVLGACLTHEICIIVCGVFSVLTHVMLGKQHTDRRLITLPFLLPTVFALAVNAVDYLVVNPSPALRGPMDRVKFATGWALLDSLWSFIGAIGVALFAPWAVQITALPDWSHLWLFSGMDSWLILVFGILVVLILSAAAYIVFRFIRHGGQVDVVPLAASMFLLFFLTTFAVCTFRFITRGVDYLYEATYYFSFFVISLCGILSVLFARIPGQRVRQSVTILMAVIAGLHIMSLRSFLGTDAQARITTENIFSKVREEIGNNSQTCFAGMDPVRIPEIYSRWTPLFQDISCTERPNAVPLYLSISERWPVLSVLNISGQPAGYRDIVSANTTSPVTVPQFSTSLVYGTPFEFTLSKTPAFFLGLSRQYGLTQSLYVDHNVVSIVGRERKFSSLSFNSGQQDVSYRVEFTQNEVVFLANNIMVCSFPREQKMEGAPVSVVLFSRQGASAINLKNFKAAQQPAPIELRMQPTLRIDLSQR